MLAGDSETIPFADTDLPGAARALGRDSGRLRPRGVREQSARSTRLGPTLLRLLIVGVCSAHGLAIWQGLGGLTGITNGWPLWRDDHPLYYHSALVTRSFLKSTWTTAGYDPSFMAGYAKSVVFPSSSTLPEVVVAAFGGDRPELAYKVYVFVAAAIVPWLVVLACALWKVSRGGTLVAVVLDLLYIWTDFPVNYVTFGMLPYFVAVPLALVATGVFVRFLNHGGASRWLESSVFLSMAFLCHLTTAMLFVPASAAAYVAAIFVAARRDRSSESVTSPRQPQEPGLKLAGVTHVAVWLIPIAILALNAFWWLPGIWLASTKGSSDFAFAHPEGVGRRLTQIVSTEAPVEVLLIGVGVPGLAVVMRRSRVAGWALLMFCASGVFWGYLAGGIRSLDFLQPGRHTYACFTALAVAGGAGVDEAARRLRGGRERRDHLDRWVFAGAAVIAIRLVVFPQPGSAGLIESVRSRVMGVEPFLSSRPSPRLLWVVDRVRRYVKPGSRLLYEEGGFGLPGVADPFQRGRFSGLLPERTGAELIGGPYLHASLEANFTQFGEGRLYGKGDWDRAHFVRYAQLYRPAAILCWSPHARRFCLESPDLVEILEDDGTVLIGKVLGFDGDFIKGGGRVTASGGRIRVEEMTPDLDGSLVLRYHSVPYLKASPSVAIEQEFHEDDPVPFIRLRPPAGTRSVELEMQLPIGR
jgi:hypothetical protein